MRRNALRTRIARTILSLLFVMSFSVSAPAFALTDAECRLSNGGTCEYSNCNSGEQKIGDCSDNIAQKTCCVSSASGITAPKQFSYSDCANISEADCSNPIVKSTCAIQCVDCNDVKSIATCSDLNILGKCPTQCTSLCSGSNLTPVNAGNCGDCVAITTYGEAHGYPSGILDSVKSTCYNIPGADAAIKKAEDDACPELDKGCCTKVINPGDANGVGRVTKTVCQGKPTITSGDCYCIANGVVSPPKSNLTYAACANACHEDGGQIDTTQGIGRLPPSGYGATGKPLEQSVNAMCFKPEDCADQGGEFTGVIPECPAGQGKCRAPEPAITLSSFKKPTVVHGLREYVDVMYRYLIAISVVAASIVFVWGGFKYIVSGTLTQIATGKEWMINAAVGLLLLFGATTILNTVNPATTRYDKLDVFMINKLELSTTEFCSDFKTTGGGALNFADAGNPPGSADYNKATFDIGQAQTLCGKDYYRENTSGQTCKGNICAEQGKSCLSCRSGLKECNGNKEGYACVSAAFAGNVGVTDGVLPQKILLMGVCNWVQPPKTVSQVSDNIPDYIEAEVSSASDFSGYVVHADLNKLESIKSQCASKGGLRGFVLGVIYKDTEEASKQAYDAYKYVENKEGTGWAVFDTFGVFISAKIFGNVNDALIVTKAHCIPDVPIFGGYANGGIDDFSDMKKAFYHGYTINPVASAQPASLSGTRFDDNDAVYWRYEDLKQAMSEGGKAITCNFDLTPKNAPPDPEVPLWQVTLDPFKAP